MLNNSEKHPSYGMLAFHRVTGGDPNLFGSSVKHNQKIMLTLKEGEITRELNNDWYTGGKTLFEVEMSYTQFAELISAMNVGNGIPVTIRYTADKGQIEGIDIKNKRTQFLDEFKAKNNDSAENIKNIINTLTAIFNEKKPIKAADRKEILSALNRLYNDVTSHNDFILNQFNESMEHITTEAKGEVEAFVQNKMNSIALAALKAELPSDFTPDNPILISESNE
jgi:hypothetical protein